jgi:hypothetical protein
MEKVRPGTGRETGLGHAGGRAMHGAIAEKERMRGSIYLIPPFPTLPLREKESNINTIIFFRVLPWIPWLIIFLLLTSRDLTSRTA